MNCQRLLKHLHTYISAFDLTRLYLIAYSGGLDSHVLLHAMAQLRQQIPELSLQAIHVHHGLNPQADQWVEHCRAVCADLQVDFNCERILDAPKPKQSIEAWARDARYSVFAKRLTPNALLLTAHTQDDQAETLLLQLLRGAGPKGLAAMPQQQDFSAGILLRPLLNLTRQQLHEYASQHSLNWIEDDSNADHRFDRNFLRHRVMSVLRERWPGASKNMARSAKHCAEAADNLFELAQLDLQLFPLNTASMTSCAAAKSIARNEGEALSAVFPCESPLRKEGSPQALSIELLRGLSPARQRNVLRYWLRGLGCQLPNTQHIQRIQQDLIDGRDDSQPHVSWGTWTLRRFRQSLILSPPTLAASIDEHFFWDLSAPLQLPHGLGRLSAVHQLNGGLSLAIDPQQLTIRFRKGGERCQPAGKKHSTSLKKLFQQWGVPPWQRAAIPLLYHGDELAAVIPYCICEKFAAKPNTISWSVTLM